jgi:hypothetical protein
LPLLKSATPGLTINQLRARTLGSAIDIGSAGFDRNSGVGIVMADSALAAVAPSATFTDQPLVVGVTTVKAVHITELRQYVATLRNINGLTAVAGLILR